TRFSRDWSSDVCSSDLIGPWGDDAQGRNGHAVRVFDRGGEAMGKGVRDAIEREEAIDSGLTDFTEKLLQRQTLAVGQDEIIVVRSEERRVGKVGRTREC